MTLHTAKGLEFPVVFLTGHGGRHLPAHAGARPTRKELEEERRLAYVGITRARERLYLSRGRRSRSAWGAPQYNPPSRFLDEIPGDLVDWQRARPVVQRRPRLRPPGPSPCSPARRRGARRLASVRCISLNPGDRVTHDSFGLGTVRARRGRRRQGDGARRLRRGGRQAPAAALRARRQALTGPVGVLVRHAPPAWAAQRAGTAYGGYGAVT